MFSPDSPSFPMFSPGSSSFPVFSTFSAVFRFCHHSSPHFSFCFLIVFYLFRPVFVLTRVLKGELKLARPLYPLAGVISTYSPNFPIFIGRQLNDVMNMNMRVCNINLGTVQSGI